MAHDVVRDEVTYYSDGLKIAADCYTPADWRPGDPARPGIVTLSGCNGITDVHGMDVPRRLWQEGYFVLTIDDRGFGKSEGARRRQRPLQQAQDTHDALTFLEAVNSVAADRLGIYGARFGGANAIGVAAFDERVKVVVSSVMVADGERSMRTSRRPHECASFREHVPEAAGRRVRTGEPTSVPLTDVMVTDPHTQSVLEQLHQQSDLYVPEFDLESAEACWRDKPEWVAGRVAPRAAMIIDAENDMLAPVQEQLECVAALGETKTLVLLPNAQHCESYHITNPEIHAIGLCEAVAWFGAHL